MDEVKELIRRMKGEVPGPRVEATRALVKVGNAAVPALLDALEHGDILARENAVEALGEIGGPEVVGALIGRLSDEGGFVQRVTVRALLKLAKTEKIDLDAISSVLVDFGGKKTRKEMLWQRRNWALETYVKIAKAVSERKKNQMDGEMLPARIPKPTKKKIYRQRRVSNG